MKPLCAILAIVLAACSPLPELRVKQTEDFDVTGTGDAAVWKSVAWTPLRKRQPDGHPYDARFKMLYSKTGVYFLLDGTDTKLTTTGRKDFENLWEEDVFEVFLWTDEGSPVYLEYEISPMNAELPLLVSNNDGTFMGWLPWFFMGERKTRKATAAKGGPKEPGAAVQGWSAEVFVPYALFKGLKGAPPASGSRWRANVYRIDYDGGKLTEWDWAPVESSFHEYKHFGSLIFE